MIESRKTLSVNVNIFGSDVTSDEYNAALKLKDIIKEGIPSETIGEIVIFVNATLFGQAVKDVDLLMIGNIRSNYYVLSDSSNKDDSEKEKVYIKSFCTTIEVKSHDISGVFRNGTDIYVKYGADYHCATLQSNRQKISAMDFFKRTILYSPYVTNLIWFTQITPREIEGLLTNNSKVMPSNIIGNTFEFSNLMNLIILQMPPRIQNGKYVFDSEYNERLLNPIQNALSLFSETKRQMGELSRHKIEQLTNENLKIGYETDTCGKILIYRGRAGTGKTVGLLQTALRLVNDEGKRVLFITYNNMLVSDIRRLLALAEYPDLFQEKCLHVCTMHSYMFRLANHLIYDNRLSGDKFIDKYSSVLKELNKYLISNESFESIQVKCQSNIELNWDYVIIDEAQDCSEIEQDIILSLFDKGHIIISDGGQQLVRDIEQGDWYRIVERKCIKFKYCIRQKENLISFINVFSQKQEMIGMKILSLNIMIGGNVIITSDSNLNSVHNSQMQKLIEDGNVAYDMLYLVPHALVNKRQGINQFALSDEFRQNGILYWDGTDTFRRNTYSINSKEIRLLQYDSCRGLEGWTVVCMDFDVFIEEKENEFTYPCEKSYDFETPDEIKKKFVYYWSILALTRAIDTIIITIKNPDSHVGKLLYQIAHENRDYVSIV